MVVPCVRGVSDRAGPVRVSRSRRVRSRLPHKPTASAPQMTAISRLNTRPARTSVDASARPSRGGSHDSRPAWFATPSPYDSSIHSTMPVFTGARATRPFTAQVGGSTRVANSRGRAWLGSALAQGLRRRGMGPTPRTGIARFWPMRRSRLAPLHRTRVPGRPWARSQNARAAEGPGARAEPNHARPRLFATRVDPPTCAVKGRVAPSPRSGVPKNDKTPLLTCSGVRKKHHQRTLVTCG